MLRIIGYVLVGLLAVAVVGAGSVYAVDTWRAATAHPGDCEWLLHSSRGDLREDDDVLQRAWDTLTGPGSSEGDHLGSEPVLNRSCLLFAGRTPGGATVVYADTTTAGYQSLIQIAEIRLPDQPDADAEYAIAAHSTLLGSELHAGAVLPLSGAYLAPSKFGDVASVTVLSAADGYSVATEAPAVGDGLFDLRVGRGGTITSGGGEVGTDALLLLHGPDMDPTAVALPTGPERDYPLPARAAFGLSVEGGTPDEGTLRRIGPALSAMSADPRYGLVRDQAKQLPLLHARIAPEGITLAPASDKPVPALPTFTLPTSPPPGGALPTN